MGRVERGAARKVAGVRPVGFFDELMPGWGFRGGGSIKDAARTSGEPDEQGILSYLRQGAEIWSEMGAQPDVLDPEGPILAGAGSLYTDGVWLWRDDLTYYVATYHLVLPQDFITHVRERDHAPPRVPESQLLDILTNDLGIRVGRAGTAG
ncbi:hypothetical protein [Streptomyces sp. NPDC004250]|uniref:hypothetical protein n=1 Tax=Streptomyces sp. NPDC004250 TaxID=3364692 RepID=UPI0036C639F4